MRGEMPAKSQECKQIRQELQVVREKKGQSKSETEARWCKHYSGEGVGLRQLVVDEQLCELLSSHRSSWSCARNCTRTRTQNRSASTFWRGSGTGRVSSAHCALICYHHCDHLLSCHLSVLLVLLEGRTRLCRMISARSSAGKPGLPVTLATSEAFQLTAAASDASTREGRWLAAVSRPEDPCAGFGSRCLYFQ